jgi:hypothetical protein
MHQEQDNVRASLKSPRAAGIAGILFSLLFMASVVLVRLSVPFDPLEATDLAQNGRELTIALNLIPFAGIAFLWFIGVVRDRFGAAEDRLFATVFLGSGLLFLAMVFSAAALAAGVILIYGNTPGQVQEAGIYTFGRTVMYSIMNIYAIKMAGVFMLTATTISLRLKLFPRWVIILSYVLALALLLNVFFVEWIIIVFPLWVLLISCLILVSNYRTSSRDSAGLAAETPKGAS